MEKHRPVVVYGSSLSMAGIAAGLRADSNLEVLCVDPDSPNAKQLLEENDLAGIVFDLSDSPLPVDVALLRGRPGLLLVGVDPSRDEMLVLFGDPEQAHSIADLVSVIHQQECSSSSFHEESQEMSQRR